MSGIQVAESSTLPWSDEPIISLQCELHQTQPLAEAGFETLSLGA